MAGIEYLHCKTYFFSNRSKIIDDFKLELSAKQHRSDTNQEALAYFYCNYREEARRDPTSIFRTLVKQLCVVNREEIGSLPESVLSIYWKQQSDGSGPLDLNHSRDLIVGLSARFSQTTIIIDALDECNRETRIDLFRMLKNILNSTMHIRIFLTGRCDGDIHQLLDDFPSHYIEACDNTADIKTYINAEIERCFQELRIPQDLKLKSEIISALVNGANGMYVFFFTIYGHTLHSLKPSAGSYGFISRFWPFAPLAELEIHLLHYHEAWTRLIIKSLSE